MPAKAASTARSTGAMKVMTERLCDASEDTSSTETPSTAAMAERIASTTSGRRPSEKFGTHSTSFIAGKGEGSRKTGGDARRRAPAANPNESRGADRVEQPFVHRRAAGDEASVHETADVAAFEIGHHTTGLAHEQHAGRDIPRSEAQLPETLKPSIRDGGEVERRGPRATDAGGRSHHGRELALIRLDVREVLEREAGADERLARIHDR